jgi:hypothetical protein
MFRCLVQTRLSKVLVLLVSQQAVHQERVLVGYILALVAHNRARRVQLLFALAPQIVALVGASK